MFSFITSDGYPIHEADVACACASIRIWVTLLCDVKCLGKMENVVPVGKSSFKKARSLSDPHMNRCRKAFGKRRKRKPLVSLMTLTLMEPAAGNNWL